MANGRLTSEPARRRLAEEYLARHHEIEGWLDDTAARVTARLLERQVALRLSGNVLEIGVHHGRYFLVLATGLTADESAVAIDVFDDQDLNISGSGRGNWLSFVSNLRRFAPHVRIQIVKADSTQLNGDFVHKHVGVRFFSIDGGHDRATACSDLWLADKTVREGAVVALDDIYRPDWSGVTAGLARYFDEGGRLVPFAFIPNKLLLTTDVGWAERYRAMLREDFAAHCSVQHPSLELFSFNDLLLVWSGANR
jgi:hypothetical protein